MINEYEVVFLVTMLTKRRKWRPFKFYLVDDTIQCFQVVKVNARTNGSAFQKAQAIIRARMDKKTAWVNKDNGTCTYTIGGWYKHKWAAGGEGFLYDESLFTDVAYINDYALKLEQIRCIRNWADVPVMEAAKSLDAKSFAEVLEEAKAQQEQR